jgi:hypothetical protein
MQVIGRAQALDGDQLLAGEAERGRHTGVDGDPLGARCAVAAVAIVAIVAAVAGAELGPGDEHAARAALALGATLLRAGQPVGAQPIEQGDARVAGVERE